MGRVKVDKDEFNRRLNDKFGDKVSLVGDFTSLSGRVDIRCNDCGFVKNATVKSVLDKNNHKKGYCSECVDPRMLTQKQFEESVYKIYGDDFTVISKYTGGKNPISMKCNKCNHVRELVRAQGIYKKENCINCTNTRKYTTDEVGYMISDLTDGEYQISGEYKNAQEGFLVKHISDECNHHEFKTYLGNFIRQGRRCPECTFVKSKGEQKVEEFLLDNNISYVSQYRFDDCRNKRPLPFDFAVTVGDSPIALIEYDGRQHYDVMTGVWSNDEEKSESNFAKVKENDLLKKNYCLENNIPLLTIPYWEFDNIDKMLIRFLEGIPLD